MPIDILLRRKPYNMILRLSKVWKKTNEKMKEIEKIRERKYVVNILPNGHRVHLSHHPIGMNKIQPRYKSESYEIIQSVSPQTYQV